jgi:hypothetical protein
MRNSGPLSARAAMLGLAALLLAWLPILGQDKTPPRPLRLDPPNVSTDKTIKIDYDIVYVRLPWKGFRTPNGKFESPIWAQAGVPLQCIRAPSSCCSIPTAAKSSWSRAARVRSPTRSSPSMARGSTTRSNRVTERHNNKRVVATITAL